MKKLVLTVVALSVTVAGMAQKSNIQSALNSLRNKELKDAQEYIEKAINDPSTKADPKAWLTRGKVYMAMQQDPGYKDNTPAPYKEAVKSYMKVAELKGNYEREEVSNSLLFGAYNYYNEAVSLYNNKNFNDAYDAANKTVTIHDMDGGKRYEGNKSFDTVAAGASVIAAYSAYYGEIKGKALPALEKLKDNPIEGNANIYLMVADIYRKEGNKAKEKATLEAARKKYPDNANVRNEELNYYIRYNEQDALIKKLQEAVTSEPDNPVYQYNLANAYTNMAFPKDAQGKSLGKPENYSELVGKAEAGFNKAIEKDPDNTGYHYDLGVLYFNQASEITEEMNKYTGTSAEETKKWEELSKQRDALFGKAMPHLEKVYTTYEPQLANLSVDDKQIYQSALIALREMYARQNKMDKAAEMKTKLDKLH